MPANFPRMLSAVKVGSHSIDSDETPANTERLLKSLLQQIYLAHHGESDIGMDIYNESVENLLFWPTRDWRIIDDPSVQARYALALQCTTQSLKNFNLLKREEDLLLKTFTRVYLRGIVNPGEGVGAVGSSCIGEPSTQMTLNIFHYSGIAEKNVTLTGLPRFKQIINAVDTADTANMRIAFNEGSLGSVDEHRFSASARASRLVSTGLSSVTLSSRVCLLDESNLSMKLATLTAKTCRKSAAHPQPLPKKVSDRVSSAVKSSSYKKSATTRLSSHVAVFILDKDAMLSRKLSVEDVGRALKDFMGTDSVVTWSAKWCDIWDVTVNPPTWVNEEEIELDEIVTNSVHDSLLEHVTVNGISAIKKAVPEKINGRWVIETEGSDILEVGASSTDVD